MQHALPRTNTPSLHIMEVHGLGVGYGWEAGGSEECDVVMSWIWSTSEMPPKSPPHIAKGRTIRPHKLVTGLSLERIKY
jgi:hypothetical protein